MSKVLNSIEQNVAMGLNIRVFRYKQDVYR